MIVKQPWHLTSMKNELGLCTNLFFLCFCFSSSYTRKQRFVRTIVSIKTSRIQGFPSFHVFSSTDRFPSDPTLPKGRSFHVLSNSIDHEDSIASSPKRSHVRRSASVDQRKKKKNEELSTTPFDLPSCVPSRDLTLGGCSKSTSAWSTMFDRTLAFREERENGKRARSFHVRARVPFPFL